ncbi:hypothetical protein IHQ71_30910 (plasmid) [Rhizobium sp. TH2]|uniref:hypothetical protein n=1 Tax=Rhizobium sp. TH2 TaxID=2775403 RepID=UPI0021574BB6|nr:hypothetical protein [Rhizobium sp. TH2]UVC12414.1 hypothetical protein IHQ71_30910 [Rhizobium sp. TH2]
MSRIVEGFKNQVWIIREMKGNAVIREFKRPVQQANENDIIILIETLARNHLTAEEAERSPDLWRHHKDSGGNRLIFSAGQNPHYVAAMYRSDEIQDR